MTTVSAVRTLLERLDNIVLSEGAPSRYVGELRDRVVLLQTELGVIKQFLINTDGASDIREDFTRGVRQLVYEIEDAVESYAYRQEAAAQGKSGCAFRSPWKYRSMAKDLLIFESRIDELRDFVDAERDKAAARERSSSSSTGSGSMWEHRKQINPELDHEKIVVGLEGDAQRLSSLLLEDRPELSITAICGMGGIGKTTLVQSLYNEPLLVDHFHTRYWATVNPGFEAADILETMLLSLVSAWSKSEIERMGTMQLVENLHRALEGRRYLVVLDDVWSMEPWDTLRFAFPDDNNGSRILITTRNRHVAEQISKSVLERGLLSDDESWMLLKSRLGQRVIPHYLEEIGRQIVKHCGGLPLAITLIARSCREMTLGNWKAILRRLRRYQNLQAVEDILALSYNDLPFRLQPCLLYLGLFPPNQVIPLEKLYSLWVAEGMISTRALNNKARTEVAQDYLMELVDRSLVMKVEEENFSVVRQIESCWLHDLIHHLCLRIGKQEEFFEVIDFERGNGSSLLMSRVAIYLNKFKRDNFLLLNIPDARRIRSILFFDTDKSPPKATWPREFSNLKGFPWTRVLDFDGVDFRVRKLPRGIKRLIYLRYLSFRGCYLLKFPSSLKNFPFLETLDLRVRVSCVMTIPNVLRKLSRLRYLYFPLAFRSDTKDKLKLDTLKNLETLENFHASICDADDLQQLENLQILTVTVDGNNLDLQNTISSMNRSKYLRHSSLVVKNFDSCSQERLSIVEALLECNALHALDIEGYLAKLPDHVQISSSFTEMVFDGSEFDEDPIPLLGTLPNLRSLILCNNAFVARKMVCSALDFPLLTSLKLATLQSLEKLEVESGAMPCLTTLIIEQCDKLEVVPSGLTEIKTLKRLMIGSMPEGFKNNVGKMIAEMRALGSDELTVTFYDC
ncbi:putative disease resistance protein [Sesamum alatum]|uniref:Disease resistance protein n=1 Tax=Sesamum alatum TaxID=300844 RepID=A0AAE1YSY8_9LAMI|nr:putative disease resistance protein [Sesamum alatum]